jgi:exopolysaccharide production protein ExoZ
MSSVGASVRAVETLGTSTASVGRLPLIQRMYELPGSAGRITPAEGLRGMAVVMVFFVHFHALFADYARQAAVLWRVSHFLGVVGNAGVDLFFVLSGYLIYGGLIGGRGVDLGRFLRRRIRRIHPTFLAVLALYLALSFIFPQDSKLRDYSGASQVAYITENLLLLPGMLAIKPIITPAWTLSYEFFFYIVVAVLVRTTTMWNWDRTVRVAFFALVWLGYMAFCFLVSKSHVRALMFVVGILVYEALRYERFRTVLTRRGEFVSIALFLGSLAFAYFIDVRRDLFSYFPGWSAGRNDAPGVLLYQGPYNTIALSLSLFWFAAYCFSFDGLLKRVFSWTSLRYLGNMSYSFYLIHGVTLQGVALVLTFVASRLNVGASLFVAGLLIGFSLAWISSTALFFTIERPYSLHPKTTRTCFG